MTTVERATPADITELVRIEHCRGYEQLIEQWSAERHAAEMTVPGSCYLAAGHGPALTGFALLQGLDDPHGCAGLRRIATSRPGEGLGRRLLEAAVDEAFRHGNVHRLQLQVFPENGRARRLYERAGFVEEGLMREVSRSRDGCYRSMLLLSLLRPPGPSLGGAYSTDRPVP